LKAELETGDIEAIAQRVVELLKPLISGNGKREAEDRYLNVKQLSDYTGMSTQWIYNNIRHLPHINLNRKPLFKKSDIDQWLEQFRIKPQEAVRPIISPTKEINLSKARAFKHQGAVTQYEKSLYLKHI
jgi:predicted DNA-binding transcriptional regulator AlpA